MIKINYLSSRCYDVMKKRFRANEHTSMKAWILYLSIAWRKADDGLKEKECNKYFYSSLELALADMIILIVAILHKTGVTNIENLIRRRLDENENEHK